MGERQITVTLSLRDEDEKLLSKILNDNKIDEPRFFASAAEEYVRMVLGQKALARGTDLLEYRLYLLVHHVLGGAVPRERFVCDLFQVTRSRARTMIANVLSKFQYDLEIGVGNSLKAMLGSAKEDEKVFKKPYLIFRADSDALVQILNEMVREHDLDERIKPAGKPGQYRILPGVRAQLLEKLNEPVDNQ